MTEIPGVTEQTLEVGGIRLNVAQAGDGEPVLLLHGFPDNWRLWRHQMAALVGAGRKVIAPDLRGMGASDKPDGPDQYAIPIVAGDMVGVLDALGLERVSVVGHDWGASVAWAMALFAPERVEKLVAVSVGHPHAFWAAGLQQKERSWYMLWFQFPGVAEEALPDKDWAFFREWIWAGAARHTDPDMERQIADLSRPGALAAALGYYRANIHPATYHHDRLPFDLPAVRCPVMGVWGSEDPALTEEQMTGSAKHVEGEWRYERLERVDHWVPVHAPDRLSELLLDFLSAG